MPPTIELLAIGDELLLGATTDTNSTWIAHRLAREGIAVARKTTVGDADGAIRDALDAALRRTGVVVCTGGLGPTIDDMTRDAVARHYGREQHIDEGWMNVLRERYRRRGIPMPEVNRVQALLPEGATLLHNDTGTAPGIAIDDAEIGMTFLLPGVPSEMRGLMEAYVIPMLRERMSDAQPIRSRMLRTAGISEAALAERIDDIAREIVRDSGASGLSLAFLPQVASVDLRVTCRGGAGDTDEAGGAPHPRDARDDARDADALLDGVIERLKERLGDVVYADDDTDLAVCVGRMLRERGLTLSLAESCTGGLVSKRLSDAPGASEFLLAGFVTYHNAAKREFLGVRTETLAMHGAVSEQCAREMAEGARRAIGADVSVAITGIAGPGGGSEEKPVGTVWYAVAIRPERAGANTPSIVARKFVHPGSRTDIRDRAAQTALDMLRRALSSIEPAPAAAEHSSVRGSTTSTGP